MGCACRIQVLLARSCRLCRLLSSLVVTTHPHHPFCYKSVLGDGALSAHPTARAQTTQHTHNTTRRRSATTLTSHQAALHQLFTSQSQAQLAGASGAGDRPGTTHTTRLVPCAACSALGAMHSDDWRALPMPRPDAAQQQLRGSCVHTPGRLRQRMPAAAQRTSAMLQAATMLQQWQRNRAATRARSPVMPFNGQHCPTRVQNGCHPRAHHASHLAGPRHSRGSCR